MNEEEKNKIIELQTLLSQKSKFNDPVFVGLQEKQTKLRAGKSKEEYSPVWYSEVEDDKGKTKKNINPYLLEEEIEQENHFLKDDFYKNGFRYDNQLGYWRKDFQSYLKKTIQDKFKSVNYIKNSDYDLVFKLVNDDIYKDSRKRVFDQSNPYLAHFKNSTYNVKTGEMQQHNPDDYILEYRDYNLDTSGKKTPITDEWFKQTFKDEAQFMMEFIGYCFARTYEPFQLFVILRGSGSDGKSTYLRYLSKMIGEQNSSSLSLSDITGKDSRFATSQLYQKSLNYFADIGSDFVEQTQAVKSLTGGDKIKAEFKNQDPFMFENHAKLIFSANELPAFKDFTDGFKRRVCLIDYNFIDNFTDNFDMEAIYKEIPAFAYKCIMKFKERLDKPVIDKSCNVPVNQLSITPKMIADREAWLKESNNVAQFVDECCELSSDYHIGNVALRNQYKKFCDENGYKAMGKTKLNKELSNLGVLNNQVIKVNGKSAKGYKGIKLNAQYAPV